MKSGTGTPELLSPAGSLQAGVEAFRNGADAVYFGLPRFSARKDASNLTTPQLPLLKGEAAKFGKRIYAAVNTVIREEELPELKKSLELLDFLEVDALIIQDYGVLNFVRNQYPGFEIHASTQMAIHNAEGALFLRTQGISKIILARELSIPEISAIISAVPDLKYEVFIHGALCYGFSGLCLASGLLLGRSANRGECAQICRTFFSGPEGNRYYFSMKDLLAADHLKTLREAGVSSLKIEGRMKSPEYTGLVTRMYRRLLDRESAPGEIPEELYDRVKTLFSRPSTDGYLSGVPSEPMTVHDYPSHKGLRIGTVEHSGGGKIETTLEKPAAVRDGLLYFLPGSPPKPVRFGLKGLEIRVPGGKWKHSSHADRGNTIRFPIPAPDLVPMQGMEIRKISSHDGGIPFMKEGSLTPWKKPLRIDISIISQTVTAATRVMGNTVTLSRDVAVQKSVVPGSFISVVKKIFSASGDSWFIPEKISFIRNESGTDDSNAGGGNPVGTPVSDFHDFFIPPSELKQFRRDFYRLLDENLQLFRTACVSPETEKPSEAVLRSGKTLNNPAVDQDFIIDLPPVHFHPDRYLKKLELFIRKHPAEKICLGLNNAAHLSLQEYLSVHDNVSFFIGYGLYTANNETGKFFRRLIPKLQWITFWIEGSRDDFIRLRDSINENITALMHQSGPKIPLLRMKGSRAMENPVLPPMEIPLFISRSCFKRDTHSGRCPAGCSGDFSFSLVQNGNSYRAEGRECITYIYPEEKTAQSPPEFLSDAEFADLKFITPDNFSC